MSSSTPASRRTVLVTAVTAAAGLALAASPALAVPVRGRTTGVPGTPTESDTISRHSWTSRRDWRAGLHEGVAPTPGRRAGVRLRTPQGTVDYQDPHGGTTTTVWEYARWTGPVRVLPQPATEVLPSWNAHTPPGTWLRVEVRVGYTTGGRSPWYVLGVWASGDGPDVPRRTSVDGQKDGVTSVWTDTVTLDDSAGRARIGSVQLRAVLLRAPGCDAVPVLWRLAATASALPDRFEVPPAPPGLASGVEARVPHYSQNVHIGRYPEYDNGGEAWCSPTSTQMITEYWGRRPTPEELAWVRPEYDDPQVCHAARRTYDYQYGGCGNWPFNTAYAASYRDMQGVVTRLASLEQAELLVAAGIPLITSQSFLAKELDGAGYGTAGHLMTLVGFTDEGDVISADPAGRNNADVRRTYPRRAWENIWLRTKRYNENGQVRSGTGGVCYVLFPLRPSAAQRHALHALGIR
ncbi:peptidase C39 family protein [Streptomyces sp. OF3]|uniref:Peptidase C39 family protein n=1 Tax=Streptomyces alkaliterrae TaxID=2213162 RepID=A0A7W3WJ51_9ACTN|nr:peptidase C39 family protein [Streptomyces alkaliterrae]MBB1253283.1 peptidase C39 family protein [Streptomyces alkaliterrae]